MWVTLYNCTMFFLHKKCTGVSGSNINKFTPETAVHFTCKQTYRSSKCIFIGPYWAKIIEYILEGNLPEKKCKTTNLLYCFHNAGVLHIFMLYNLLGPGISFYRKSKIMLKENQIMK